jgi:hypothetical protein
MGRFLKNEKIRTAGYGAVLPYGPTSLRPTAPVPGDIRFNTDTNKVEVYYSSLWNSITREGPVNVTKDTFTGDSSQTNFTMSVSYSAGQETRLIVVIGNVFQNPGVAFTVTGTTIAFTSPPPFGQTIIVLHGYANTTAA